MTNECSDIPFRDVLIGRTPLGRWCKFEDLPGPAVFLISDASIASTADSMLWRQHPDILWQTPLIVG